uniref:Uncharacterized protein n=1 Tax=Parascaris equorum TaxID=6256 RepID=A0A914R1D1_PAREQ
MTTRKEKGIELLIIPTLPPINRWMRQMKESVGCRGLMRMPIQVSMSRIELNAKMMIVSA